MKPELALKTLAGFTSKKTGLATDFIHIQPYMAVATNNYMLLKIEGLDLPDQPIEGYPDYEAVLPKTAPTIELLVKPEYLKRMAEAYTKAKIPQVSIRIYGIDQPIEFIGNSPEVTLHGLIMPIRQ